MFDIDLHINCLAPPSKISLSSNQNQTPSSMVPFEAVEWTNGFKATGVGAMFYE